MAFDDDRLVADAGLLMPATLAQHLDLRALVEHHLHLGSATGRGNVGEKLLTLVMSTLAGGDAIDDANPLRAGGRLPERQAERMARARRESMGASMRARQRRS